MNQRSSASQLSVVIITLNEEARILPCLRSLPPGCEIVVLDSGSSDRTCDLARQFGARIEVRPFDNYANQKNAAVALASRPWILSIDADEVVDPALCAALVLTSEQINSGILAYRVRRRLCFMGRPLRFGKAVDRPIRLFQRGRAKFMLDIHERLSIDGPVGRLPGELLHYSYADLSDYFRRFNLYTSAIAANHLRNGRSPPKGPIHWLRPWGEFFYRYLLRLGFLDGYPGYTYALLSSLYTYVKYAKLKELAAASKRSA